MQPSPGAYSSLSWLLEEFTVTLICWHSCYQDRFRVLRLRKYLVLKPTNLTFLTFYFDMISFAEKLKGMKIACGGQWNNHQGSNPFICLQNTHLHACFWINTAAVVATVLQKQFCNYVLVCVWSKELYSSLAILNDFIWTANPQTEYQGF